MFAQSKIYILYSMYTASSKCVDRLLHLRIMLVFKNEIIFEFTKPLSPGFIKIRY